jgi:hypothetical protein
MSKGDQYTPESIEAVTNFYALPFEERMTAETIPGLKFTAAIEDWQTGYNEWVEEIAASKPYSGAGYDEATGLTTSAGGTRFDEATVRSAAERRYDLGVIDPETGEPSVTSVALQIDDVLTPEQREKLTDINNPLLKEQERKRMVVDWMVGDIREKTKTGQTSASVSGGKSLKDEKPPIYDPSTPDTPGEVTMTVTAGGQSADIVIPFENEYNTKVKGGSANLDSIRAGKMYIEGKDGVDLEEIKENQMVIINQDPIVIEGADVPGGGKGDYLMVDVVVEDIIGKTHKKGYIPITPSVDKELRNASDYYREKKESEETKTGELD